MLLGERVSRAVSIIYKIMRKRLLERGEFTNKVVVAPPSICYKLLWFEPQLSFELATVISLLSFQTFMFLKARIEVEF
jgi:hypothetical protein